MTSSRPKSEPSTKRAAGEAYPLPTRRAWVFNAFSSYAKRYLKKHFHAVRILNPLPPASLTAGRRLVVYTNHPSWWDPMMYLWICRHDFPQRRHYAPIDASALDQYAIFKQLGFFGLDMHSPSGARTFLRTAEAILNDPAGDTAIWMTAEGKFTDPRTRPTVLRPGLGHLAKRIQRQAKNHQAENRQAKNRQTENRQTKNHQAENRQADNHDASQTQKPGLVILPLCVEYVFWEERFPEMLISYGEPIDTTQTEPLDASEWTARLSLALETVQDKLAQAVIARDPDAFDVALAGRGGVGGVYDLGRRAKAFLKGESFDPNHHREGRS